MCFFNDGFRRPLDHEIGDEYIKSASKSKIGTPAPKFLKCIYLLFKIKQTVILICTIFSVVLLSNSVGDEGWKYLVAYDDLTQHQLRTPL